MVKNKCAYEIAIGQEIAINNLQLGMAYCAIANGGFLIKPKIIDRIFSMIITIISKILK